MSTRLIVTLFSIFVVLSLVAMMNHQTTVAVQVVKAHQTSMKGMRNKLSVLEQMLIADRAAHATGLVCKDGLQQARAQLERQMEGLLVKQEMRLIRTLGMTDPAEPQVTSHQQVIQPSTHQTILPESPSEGGMTQVVGGPPNAETRR